jgi:hypothetical protein
MGVVQMGLLDKLFGSDKQLDKLTSGAVNGLDKIFFTKEEKAEANQKLSDWYLKYLEATQPQNLARRLIAIVVVSLWAFLIFFGVLMWKFDVGWSTFIFSTLNNIVNNPFMIIIGFYFLTHAVRAYKPGDKK